MVQLQRPIAIYIRRVSETVGKVAVTSAETLAIHMVASSRATHINIYHQRMFAVVEQLHQMRVGLSIHITASTATRVVDNNKQLTALAARTNSEQITEEQAPCKTCTAAPNLHMLHIFSDILYITSM